jgi:hypothetical protein
MHTCRGTNGADERADPFNVWPCEPSDSKRKHKRTPTWTSAHVRVEWFGASYSFRASHYVCASAKLNTHTRSSHHKHHSNAEPHSVVHSAHSSDGAVLECARTVRHKRSVLAHTQQPVSTAPNSPSIEKTTVCAARPTHPLLLPGSTTTTPRPVCIRCASYAK